MDVVHVDGHLDGVAGSHGRTRRNTSGQVDTSAGQVQIGLSAHQLGNLDVAVDDAGRSGGDEHFLILEALRTNAQDNVLADVLGKLIDLLALRDGNFVGVVFVAKGNNVTTVFLNQLGVDEVHLRRTHEACNEHVGGLGVQILRSVDLLDEAVLHNNDAGTHGHSLDLVMGNVDEGGAQTEVQLGQLGPHLCTELCVQVGQRLVKEEDLRLTDDSTTQSNTLTLTAGQSLRLPVEQVGDVEDAGGFFYAALDLILGGLAELQAESHVLEDSHVRIQSVVLEHHCDIAVLRSNVVDQTVADVQLAFGNFFQAGDHTQGGGLTTAGRTDQNDKFLVLDVEVEVGNSGNAAGVFFIDAF